MVPSPDGVDELRDSYTDYPASLGSLLGEIGSAGLGQNALSQGIQIEIAGSEDV